MYRQLPACCYGFLLVLTVVLSSTAPAIAGKLARVSREARNPSPSRSSSGSSSTSGGGASGGGSGGLLLLAAVTSPWWGPQKALESDRPILAVGYLSHPYVPGYQGQLALALGPAPEEVWMGVAAPAPTVPRRNWALQLGTESGYVFDRVWRHGVNLRFQTAYRIEFDASWSLFMEREYGAVDNLAIGREHVIWRFAQSNALQFHTSFGAQHLIDEYGDLSGVDIAYGFDAFPGRPIVLSLEGALGNLGDAFAPRVRATLGMIRNRFELLAGYEHQWIGREDLGGPFIGLRIWL